MGNTKRKGRMPVLFCFILFLFLSLIGEDLREEALSRRGEREKISFTLPKPNAR